MKRRPLQLPLGAGCSTAHYQLRLHVSRLAKLNVCSSVWISYWMLLKRGVASWLTAKALLRSALLCSHAVRMNYILMNLCPSNHNLSAATCRQNASLAVRPESCAALAFSSLNWPLCFALFFFLPGVFFRDITHLSVHTFYQTSVNVEKKRQ